MARYLRRLILWLLATLLTLALLALAVLWWFLDPERLRLRLETEAGAALGRQVRIEAPLRWKAGWRIAISSAGGEVANAPGFSGGPLARWSGIELGIALRPLLRREVRIDRIEIDGLALDLQRDASGAVNWELDLLTDAGPQQAAPAGSFRLDHVTLRDADLRYRDAAAALDWRARNLTLSVDLPEAFSADELLFRDIELAAGLTGGPLAVEVPVRVTAPLVRLAMPAVSVPEYALRWSDATLAGALQLTLGDAPSLQAHVDAGMPSLRATLATFGIQPPPMRDPGTLGAFSVRADIGHADGATRIDELVMQLDDTRLGGWITLPGLSPLSLRFELAADHADLDRYTGPDDVQGEPLTLPLEALRALDAKGVLTIESATLAGAAVRRVRIDVE